MTAGLLCVDTPTLFSIDAIGVPLPSDEPVIYALKSDDTAPIRASVSPAIHRQDYASHDAPISGWAVDASGQTTAKAVYVSLDGTLYPTHYGLDRSQLAADLGNDALSHVRL